MTGRLFLHIGPPKTATTSLQIAFQDASFDWLVYGGTFQPRELNRSSISTRLHMVGNGRIECESSEAGDLLRSIQETIASGSDLLISEEMFLVGENGSHFDQKVLQIGKFLDGTPTTIILTIRDPIEGVQSLYQELYGGLSLAERINFYRFCVGRRILCYNFCYVYDMLRDAGFEDVRFIRFDEIVLGKLELSCIFDRESDTKRFLCFGVHNAGKKDIDDNKRELPPLTLKALGRVKLVNAIIDKSGVRGRPFYRKVINGLDCIDLRKRSFSELSVPHHVAKDLTTSYNAALERARDGCRAW